MKYRMVESGGSWCVQEGGRIVSLYDPYAAQILHEAAVEFWQALQKTIAERDQAREAILAFGSPGSNFDWEILRTIDEQEKKITRLTAEREELLGACRKANAEARNNSHYDDESLVIIVDILCAALARCEPGGSG